MFDETVFERVKLGIITYFTKEMIEDVSIRFSTDYESGADNYLIQCVMSEWEYMHKPFQTIEYPRDWWQAIKERWLPRWLLNKYPVIKTFHNVYASTIYSTKKPSMLPAGIHIVVKDDIITGIKNTKEQFED